MCNFFQPVLQPPSQDAQENESERVEVEVEQPSSDIVVSFNPDVAGPSRAPLVELEKNQEKKRPHKRKRESDPVPRRSYSPMTSYGIYSLTKSPLTKTVEATGSARPAGRAEPEKKKKKVNKKLDYHLAGE